MADILDSLPISPSPDDLALAGSVESTGPVSPVFVGREAESALLSEAFETARAGSARAVLLGGEAGVGKTRLVNEFAARVHGDTRVLVGGCLELSSHGLPYAPFTAALRELVRERGADAVVSLMPGGNARDLARLLPGLGEPPDDTDSSTGRVRLFEQMLTLVERLADQTPLLLLIEDAHWADRSTRDLLSFLVANLRTERVLLVITFRSDELHRTHPLRPLLADLGRMERVTRIDLPRLSRSQVAAQLAGILGHRAEPHLVEEAYRQSSGIPLFVEAVARCSDHDCLTVSESLRDLLLAGLHRLPEETQEVLRVASAADRVSHDLLALVTGLDHAELSRALRPAVDGNVLIPDQEGYAFRHALIREAIHDDLLPGEHIRLHKRFAEALEGHQELSQGASAAIMLAQHWHHAHVTERALPAAWHAAQESAAALAYAEQVQMLERVLELWDRVPEAADLVGHPQIEVMEMAAEAAAACGEAERGIAFVRAALAEVDEAVDPERVAKLLSLRAKLKSWQRGYLSELEDLRRAEKLAPGPTLVRSEVLSRLCSKALLTSSIEECLALGQESMEIARSLGHPEGVLDAAITVATISALDGDGDAADLLAITEEVRASGYERLMLRCLTNLSHFYEGSGDSERAVGYAREGVELAQRNGRVRSQGAFIAANLAESLLSLGRFDEAAEVIERMLDLPPATAMLTSLLLLRGRIALARGDLRLSGEAVEAAGRAGYDAEAPQVALPFAEMRVSWNMARGDRHEALAALRTALGASLVRVKPRYTWFLLVHGAQACADIMTDPAGIQEPGIAAEASELLSMVRDVADRTPALGAATVACANHFAAECSRAAGEVDLAAWETAAAGWESLRRPYYLAQALYRVVEAAAAQGESERAVAAHRQASDIAERLRATPLLRRLDDLARRARLHDNGTTPWSAGHGLTPRELEVLRLLSEGRTNREIAEALVISVKTVSVHVSNILGKLGAATRGEAAANAHRLGIT